MTAIRDESHAAREKQAIGPLDLVILLIGLATAWFLSAPDILAAGGQAPTDPKRIALHLAAVVEAARRISHH